MAVADPHAAEHQVLTEAAGLIDRSERGKLALTGAGAKEFLSGQVTNDTVALTPGAGCYAAFLTPKGKMLGDLRILDAGDEILLDTERISLQELFTMIRRYKIGFDVELHKRTVERGLLSLVGPAAGELAGPDAPGAAEHEHRAGEIGGVAVRLIRTDTGIDLLCGSGDAEALRTALEGRGAVPVGEAAVDCLRVERGRPRYGVDLDASVIPQEAGLNDRAVSFTKGCYVGQETVARLFYKGKPNRQLRGLRLSAPAATGEALRLGEKEVGRLGSVAVSPAHGPIALALVRREAGPGDTLSVDDGAVSAKVAELPF